MKNLEKWRQKQGLTQADAAALLGVSQTYVSLVEKGARPLTPELRMRLELPLPAPSVDDRLRAGLSALGYPGFAHLPAARPAPRPGAVLLEALAQKDVDARVAEALPWLVRQYAGKLNFPLLVNQAKLRNVQNRLGFLLQYTGAGGDSVQELEAARLLMESTFCWDSMPKPTRDFVRQRRSKLAEYWNILTTLDQQNESQ